jgi:hypothetical protein
MTLRIASATHDVRWFDHRREPQCAANPAFPDGVDIDLTTQPEQPYCAVALLYPAKRCGVWEISCGVCGTRVMATTAGRADDPRSIKIACKRH